MKVNYISWKRDDAIGKVTSILLERLEDKINFNRVILKTGRSLNFRRIAKNFISLFKPSIQREIFHIETSKKFENILNIIIRNKKSIVTVHHIETRKYLLDPHFLKNKLEHNSFSKLIAISKKTKKDLIKQYGINPKKITVAYLGIDKKIFKHTNKKVNSLKNKKYVLYLGSEIPRKNIENLLKAFKEISKKHPNLYLVKAGYSGGDSYREKTKKLIKDLELTEKVILISKRLKEEELPLYYSNAELFVYPTLQEGFGMPLVEAMACGCPVVTSNIDPMKEIVKNQVIVDPYNYKSIMHGMNRILTDYEYRNELVKKAILRTKDFSWEKFADKILKIYAELEKKN